MSHLSFYRKYRSQSFDTLVGQTHIIQTLRNAISHNRLGHAYIFSGPRGTGKTSTARILAKTLNCKSGKTPCPEAQCICKRIEVGQSMDIIEMDAASNTGVDHIRVLNDQVNFTPVECTYKMYIIDEAHMLSSGAFNALLKTVEEPPDNTIFILATTEPHKIPATIHSRCQHLQFQKISIPDIMKQLAFICEKESIQINETSTRIIAKNADGCMRDAISLLEQIHAYKGETIEEKDVLFVLGAANLDTLLELIENLTQQNAEKTLHHINRIFDSGINPQHLVRECLSLYQSILERHIIPKSDSQLDPKRQNQIDTISKKLSSPQHFSILEQLAKLESELRYFPNPKVLITVRLLNIIHTLNPPTPASPPTSLQQTPPSSKKSLTLNIPPKPTPPPSQTTPSTPPTPTIQTKPTPPPHTAPDPKPQSKQPKQPKQPEPPQKQPDIWPAFIQHLQNTNRALYSILFQAKVVKITDTKIHIKLKQDFEFFEKKVQAPNNQALFKTIFEAIGHPSLIIDTQPPKDTSSPSTNTTTSTTPPKPKTFTDEKQINQIVEMFNGTIIKS